MLGGAVVGDVLISETKLWEVEAGEVRPVPPGHPDLLV